MLVAYSFTSASDCSSPSMYSFYSDVVSAVVLTLLAPVGMVMLPVYVVCGPVVVSLTLVALSKLLLPAWYS